MPDPSKLLLLDIFHLTWLMLAFGLLAYALIRRSNPLIRWHEHGNVWTDPFLKVDLLLMGLILGLYYALIRISIFSEKSASVTDMESGELMVVILAQIITMTSLTGGLVFVMAYARRVDVVELFGLSRLGLSKLIVWSALMLAISIPIVIGVAVGWGALLQYTFNTEPEAQELVTTMRNSTSMATKLLIAFSACIIAPVTEEILFRGYFYPALKRYSERLFAAIVISMMFALVHSNTMSIMPLFALAMALTAAYELTGCLLVPIAMHAIFNSVQVLLMFVAPAT